MAPLLNVKQIRLFFVINIICGLFINEKFKKEAKIPETLNLLKGLRLHCFETFTQVLIF